MSCKLGLYCALKKSLKMQRAVLPVKFFLHIHMEKQSKRGERQSTTSHLMCGASSSTPMLLEQAEKED